MKSDELFQEIKEKLLLYPPKKSELEKEDDINYLISEYDFNTYNEIMNLNMLNIINENIEDWKINEFKNRIDTNFKNWNMEEGLREYIKYISLYLTFISKQPLHPYKNNKNLFGVYEKNSEFYCCNKKKFNKEENSLCFYCICKEI
jgi:uncharacterized protein (UPF0305 family)